MKKVGVLRFPGTNCDRDVFQAHLHMAQMIGSGDRELYDRYYFQLHVQGVVTAAGIEEMGIARLFAFLAQKGEGLTRGEFQQVVAAVNSAHERILAALQLHGSAPLPVLRNMQAGAPLGACMLDEPLVPAMGDRKSSLDRQFMTAFTMQVRQMSMRSRRLYFKSMGAILAKQEAISDAWRAVYAAGEPGSP